MIEPKTSAETWTNRIAASRTRRDEWVNLWSEYARLHTNAYIAARAQNDDKSVTLPSGDQVKLGLIHRNVEQTMAILEVPEIGVRVTATDYARELTGEDTHRESVVEAALVRSMKRSGFVKGTEEVDAVKRDAVIVGHGINYSYWRQVQREIQVGMMPVMIEQEDGTYAQQLGDDGAPAFEPLTEQRVIWDNVQDCHVSPIEFLFDARSNSIVKSPWHGMEKIVKADALREDPTMVISDDIEATSFTVRDLYGENGREDIREDDCYRQVIVWDKTNYELITFIEGRVSRKVPPTKRGGKAGNDLELRVVKVEPWPVTFDHPDDSPFSFFVPVPANDFPWGISQIEHIRNPSMEADKTRTRLANQVRQARRIPWYRKGKVDSDQLLGALNGTSGDPVGLDMQDGDKPADLFGELPVPRVDADLYSAAKDAEDTIRWTSGITEIPQSGAGTATESENIMAIGGARPNRKRRLMLAMYTDVARKHLAFRREFDPPGQRLAVVGPDGVPLNLVYGRDAFQGALEVEVLPGGEATTVSALKQKFMLEGASLLMGRFSPQFDRIYARQLLTAMDVRDINAMLQAMPLAQAQSMMAAGGGVDGRDRQGGVVIGDQTPGQAIRAATNAPNEGALVQRAS